jgi:hypothetical protein
MTMRTGACPDSCLVVSRGLSRRTVCPPTMTASDRDLVSNTLARDVGAVTQALWPVEVAILPSRVIAYFRMPRGLPLTALCSSAWGEGSQAQHHVLVVCLLAELSY